MKITKNKLIEAKFVVPMDKVDDFDADMESELEDDDVIQVVDENKFIVPSEDIKDFDNEMGDKLEKDDTVHVYDEDKPEGLKKITTKESMVLTKGRLREGILSAIALIKDQKKTKK